MNLQELRSKRESETLEFKESLGEWKEIVETVCAFANSKRGIILVGVRDNGEILVNKIKENTEPKVFPSISIEKVDDKEVIVIRVEESLRRQGFQKDGQINS